MIVTPSKETYSSYVALNMRRSKGLENFFDALNLAIPNESLITLRDAPFWHGYARGVSHDVKRVTRIVKLTEQLHNGGLQTKDRTYNRRAKRVLHLHSYYFRMARQIEILFSQRSPDFHLILWGGVKGSQGIAAAVARKHLWNTTFFELSPFPGRVFYDSQGVNVESQIARWQDLGVEPAKEARGRNLLEAFRQSYAGRKTPNCAQLNFPLPKYYVFAPLQVPYDSNVLVYSGRFKSDIDYLSTLKVLAHRLGKDRYLVIKPHPQFPYLPNELENYFSDYSNIKIFRQIPTRTLIEGAKGVVTLNSTVGFDALCFGKPVVVMGRAHYAHEKLTINTDTIDEAIESIDAQITPDTAKLRRFIADFYDNYTTPETPEGIRQALTNKCEQID